MVQPNFKKKGAAKAERRARRAKAKASEKENKDTVRERDRRCRFPFCGCKRFGLAKHVAHLQHKGMGGNPAMNRSGDAGMILVCSARHRENKFSMDQGTIEPRALSTDGMNGPVSWHVRVADLPEKYRPAGWDETVSDPWFEVARERGIGTYETVTSEQRAILAYLSSMDV